MSVSCLAYIRMGGGIIVPALRVAGPAACMSPHHVVSEDERWLREIEE
jgi:hypothetical protein